MEAFGERGGVGGKVRELAVQGDGARWSSDNSRMAEIEGEGKISLGSCRKLALGGAAIAYAVQI